MSSASPEFGDSFVQTYDAGTPQVLWAQIPADLETPVSAMLKLADGQPYSFLLDSVEGGAILGRYSFIGIKPDVIWRVRGQGAEINRRARQDFDAFEPDGAPIESLRRLIQESQIDLPAHLPPMSSLVAGYLGFGAVQLVEPTVPDPNPDPLGIPDGIFLRPTLMSVFDNVAQKITLVTPVRPQKGVTARAAFDLAAERLADAVADFQRSVPFHRESPRKTPEVPTLTAMTPKEAFLRTVEKAKEYIRAGDIFQIVPSQRFTMPFRLPPFLLYRSLRRTNPSPFMFYMDFADFHIVGSSPEILVRLRDDELTIRPIAGTRPRGKTPDEDRDLADDLLKDEKERAEHLMLLDLARNDVGRVAEIGSVKVDPSEKMYIEYYSHVMHIVSNVTGRLRKGLDALDALLAGFPAGTVSGAPKVRAMEILTELEPIRRSFYGGTVGYFSANGAMDSCITLRTCLVKDGVIHMQAGAGIVADSVAESEHEECLNKARAIIRAAEDAVQLSGR